MYFSKLPVPTLMSILSLPHASVLAFTTVLNKPQHQLTLQRKNALRMSPSFDDKVVDMQKKVGENEGSKTTSIDSHLTHQQDVFNEMSTFFNSEDATPEEVKPILRFLTKRVLTQVKTTKGNEDVGKFDVLDVGCGTGALFPYYLEAANELNMGLNILGLDLSPKMVKYANENASKLVAAAVNSRHSIRCESGDFVERVMGVSYCKETLTGFDNGVLDEGTQNLREKFDAVVINACFGNFFDLDYPVTAAARALRNGGTFAISHPLGSEFVEKLRNENPSTVPNLLPTESRLNELLQFQPLTKTDFLEAIKLPTRIEDSRIYYAQSERVPHTILRQVLRLRGPVDQGFRRGGKKLGFPTANLPSSLFSNALANVPTGVYIGWAVVEGSLEGEGDVLKGRNVIHKAVVNVGYSPTFDGQENKEKIVEGHLIVEDDDIGGDFYGETMRLALHGYLRPEKRFPSFADLIAAITHDVVTAKKLLDSSPYCQFSQDDFLTVDQDKLWVGTSGGDDHASFEFGR